jgi:hypothetical protein
MEATMTTMGELKAIVDALHDLHGSDAIATFVYQKSAGRTGAGDLTSYRVSVGFNAFVRFNIGSPRGEAE